MKTQTHSKSIKDLHVGIIGGGFTGLTSAFYLLRAGAKVTVLEAGAQPGGLATFHNFGPFFWDKFYHCILTSDSALLQLLDDLGLTNELHWTETKTGFFVNGKIHSMSSALDFLRFPPLSLWQKIRLGVGIVYAARIREGRSLESRLASEWLVQIFGIENYSKLWGPLLKCKLGACREETSAAFIWTYIARYYSTRDKTANQKERLGYVTGGYHTVFKKLLEEIERMGGRVATAAPVSNLVSDSDVGIHVSTPSGTYHFDKVIATVPNRPFAAMAPQLTLEYVTKLQSTKYLGVLCFALLLKRKLSPYYVLNLTDEDLPFTGIIEMTSLVSREETAGHHLVYLPKYTVPGDPLFGASDADLWQAFRAGLRRVFPDLQDSEIEARHLFRERFVQPVPVLKYSETVPDMKTNVPGLFLANTTQLVNSNLNNNAMTKIATRAVESVLKDVPAGSAQSSISQLPNTQAPEYSSINVVQTQAAGCAISGSWGTSERQV
jgi:protoporphyrinogen oxidase